MNVGRQVAHSIRNVACCDATLGHPGVRNRAAQVHPARLKCVIVINIRIIVGIQQCPMSICCGYRWATPPIHVASKRIWAN